KSEGSIPVDEFTTREGELTVHEGDEIDVYFEASDTETGDIVLSRQKAEQFKVWREIEKAYERDGAVEGTIVGKVKGGPKVDIGGIDGLLHVTDMSWGRVGHPSEIVNVSDRVKVVVLKYDPERERVSLGMKQIMPDPWTTIAERLPINARVRGKVVSLTDYGAF